MLGAAFLTALTGVGVSGIGRMALVKSMAPYMLSGLGMGMGYGMGVNVGYNVAAKFTQNRKTSPYKYYGKGYYGIYARMSPNFGGNNSGYHY